MLRSFEVQGFRGLGIRASALHVMFSGGAPGLASAERSVETAFGG